MRDSVNQTTYLPAVGLGNSFEDDGRVRPRSVNLLGKKRRRKKKGVGKKPQEAVALADLKSKPSAIIIGDSQAQGNVRGEEGMEGVVEGGWGRRKQGDGLSGREGKRSGSPAVSGFPECRTCV